MANATVALRAAALARYRAEVSEDVHDHAPLRHVLPYAALVRASVFQRVRLNKTTVQWEVDLVFELVTDPHSDGKTADAMIDDFDAAFAALLAPVGFTVQADGQFVASLEVFSRLDEAGAELKIAELTLRCEVI